jgi:RimJ/RimL family protein N-acetyltransferase
VAFLLITVAGERAGKGGTFVKTLTSERLRLRSVTNRDFSAIAAMDSDPRVMRYLCLNSPVPSYQQALEEAHYLLELRAPSGGGTWAITCRTTQTFFGWVWVVLLGDVPYIDLGYRLAPRFWRYGYATEAGRRVAHYAFFDLEIPDLTALVHPLNFASARVAEKVGLSLAGKEDFLGTVLDRYSVSRAHYVGSVSSEGAPLMLGLSDVPSKDR